MIILAIDTCEAYCSAAIVKGGNGLARYSEKIGRGHAEKLLPAIEQLLIDASLSWRDLEKIAVISGPGTFTGLRIGLSVARGLALSLQIPCVGMSALKCLALQADHIGIVHACIAGRGETSYYQQFNKSNNGVIIAETDAASLQHNYIVNAISNSHDSIIIGSGAEQLATTQDASLHTFINCPCDTIKLGIAAKGLDAASNPPDPHYLRAPDAAKAKPIFSFAST
jgi:tRNA threonylcarbamoyladenosine biosynthesis protein TsaB